MRLHVVPDEGAHGEAREADGADGVQEVSVEQQLCLHGGRVAVGHVVEDRFDDDGDLLRHEPRLVEDCLGPVRRALRMPHRHLDVVQEACRVQDVLVVLDAFSDLPREVVHPEGVFISRAEPARGQVFRILLDELSHGGSVAESRVPMQGE